jgi:nucleoside-diphosphate-sugar epimerase
MEILITGGNGLIGHHLVTALQERGDSVRVLVLPTEDTRWLKERGVTIYQGDICDYDTLKAPMRNVDTIFHLAAMHGGWLSLEEYSKVNVGGTENVCRAALASSIRRLVHVSSWTYYGKLRGRRLAEEMPPMPWQDAYRLSKVEGDLLVQRMIARDHLPATIVRPGTVFGPGDRVNFGRTADKLCAGKGLVLGSGRNLLPLVYVTDVVQGLLLSADRDCAVGQAYNISNDQPLTQEEFLRAIAQELGVAPPRLHIPFRAAYAIAFAAEQVAKIMHSDHPIVTRHGVILYGGENRHSIDKARSELGYAPQVSIREGVKRAAAWYKQSQMPAPLASPANQYAKV